MTFLMFLKIWIYSKIKINLLKIPLKRARMNVIIKKGITKRKY